jgi:hypothetical protein
MRFVRKPQHCDVNWPGEFGERKQLLDRRLAG